MLTLQNIIAPEPGVCSEPDLYYHATGAAQICQQGSGFCLLTGSRIRFDTYFNLFNLGTWTQACLLEGLILEITARGPGEIRVLHLRQGHPAEILHQSRPQLHPDSPYQIDLSALLSGTPEGLLALELVALGPEKLQLYTARFATRRQPPSLPRLAISITTFQREHKVRDTVARLDTFLARSGFGDNIHVQVIDNGQSADIRAGPRVTAYANRNLGGAGGFARGLLEAEDRGFSHCLFMDDDASFHMENILRSYMLLTLARDPQTALAGAMIGNRRQWEMWENGAYFDGSCHPLFNGIDLRCPQAVQQMELRSTQARPATFYGGWWFFAFPLAGLRRHPFPFFVRGDDISFSLANDFNIFTLNGVVSFQDDFIEKESAQTLYLDLRNHLLHHLIFAQLERSALGTARIACRFMMRSMLRCKYESAAAQLMAWRDVMQGPVFFDRNIDMQARQASIRALIKQEHWQQNTDTAPQERRCFSRLPRRLRHLLGLFSLNGHLLPFWSRVGDQIVLEIDDRGLVFPAFGAARLTYRNGTGTQAYTVRHSKARFFALAWQMLLALTHWLRHHEELKRAYRRGYGDMTTRPYWEAKLGPARAPRDQAAE